MTQATKQYILQVVEVFLAICVGVLANMDKLKYLLTLGQLQVIDKRARIRKVYRLETRDMMHDFDGFIRNAIEGKFYPGYPEIAYGVLAKGGSVSDVRARLGATKLVWDRWLEESEEFRVAIELGLEAGTAHIQNVGYENLTAKHFQSKVWQDLLHMLPKASQDLNELVGDKGGISIRFERLDDEE